ncbi:DUF4279 domain-containing protein [Bacillus mesophilum]|uniref:DUF4279 domain-containing protein n=1 Tax=Bacillus mesophilum TaxID=1071718 RepID=A0A7V7UX73_9BACI|nr:DUF4279 domain-containing protein [Bacillus mesophilum]KAB2335691.1 DUF4279 domain-containing protein [Bacillus mesophilum]
MDKTKIMVYFNLYADDFPLEQVTARLGLTPTRSFKKGDVIRKVSTNYYQRRSYSAWQLSTGYQESLDVSKLIEPIFVQLQDQADAIKELKKDFGLECRFVIVIVMNEGYTPGFHLDHPFIEFANSVGADIDIDLYANPYTDDGSD